MAEPTLAEKVAAAKEALADLGVQDADEAARAVAVFWSQVPLLPAATAAEPTPPVIVSALLTSEDPAIQAQLKELSDKALALLKAMR